MNTGKIHRYSERKGYQTAKCVFSWCSLHAVLHKKEQENKTKPQSHLYTWLPKLVWETRGVLTPFTATVLLQEVCFSLTQLYPFKPRWGLCKSQPHRHKGHIFFNSYLLLPRTATLKRKNVSISFWYICSSCLLINHCWLINRGDWKQQQHRVMQRRNATGKWQAFLGEPE